MPLKVSSTLPKIHLDAAGTGKIFFAPKGPIRAPVKRHRRAIPSRSSCCPQAIAARSRAEKPQRERKARDSSVNPRDEAQLDSCPGGDRAALPASSGGGR